METYSAEELRKICPVKWHDSIPDGGISLGVADVDFIGPKGVTEYIREQLIDAYGFYQAKRGLPQSLEIICQYLQTLNVPATPLNVQITPGTMMGIYAAMKYASRREGHVVCVGPLYEPIHLHAKDTGNKVVFSHITTDGMDHEMLKETVQDAKLLAINNPSNPIGYVYNSEDLKLIEDLVSDNELILLSDELYAPLVFNRSEPFSSAGILDSIRDQTILLFGYSKAYGLAGYRSGFMYCGSRLTEEIQYIIQSQLVSPNPLCSLVSNFALTNPQSLKWVASFREEMDERTKLASQLFEDSGFQCHLPDACFFVYPDLEVNDIEFTEKLLDQMGIQIIPGSYFGPTGSGHVRVNCATSEERLIRGIESLIDFRLSY